MSQVWQHSKAKEGALLVLLAIADFADDEGTAFPYVQQLARKARLSVRMTQYAIDSLIKAGELHVERTRGRGRRNAYKVQLLHLSESKGAIAAPIRARKGAMEGGLKGAIGEFTITSPGTVTKPGGGVVDSNGRCAGDRLPPPPPKKLVPDPDPPTEQEADWLGTLQAVPDYPFEPAVDLDFVQELAKHHPPDVVSRGLTDFKRAMPEKARGHPRVQAGNYVLAAARMAAEDAARVVAVGRSPPHRNGKHPAPAPNIPDVETLFAMYDAGATHAQAYEGDEYPTRPGPPAPR